MTTNYPRPPITEAVIELKYGEQTEVSAVERIARKFAKNYPISEDQEGVELQIDTKSTEVKRERNWSGKKLNSVDQVDIVMVRTDAFSCIRLAPYNGWDEFFSRARAGWDSVLSVLSRRKISRIGVRYINRLDIPISGTASVSIVDFLNVGPNLPAIGGPISQYAFQATRPINSDGCSVTISSGTVPSPLLGHISLTLDIDVFADQISLIRDEDIWGLVMRIRDHKNRIFEASITDRARELFR